MMPGRRAAVLGLLTGLALPLRVGAQPRSKISRIGLLLLSPSPGRYVETFRDAMRQHGYVEGRNVSLEVRGADGRGDRLSTLARDLVQSKVDVLVVESGAAAVAARQATRTIPIVMGVVGDPLAAGVVTNLARPGANITGLTLQAPELSAKRLQILKEVFPKTKLVSLIYNPTNPASRAYLEEAMSAAQSLGIELHVVEVRNPAELDAAFQSVSAARPNALMTLADGMMFGTRIRVVQLAANTRVPGIFPEREFVQAGGLMSYGPNVMEVWHRSAVYVAKILKGAQPGALPIESPTKFELVLNSKTARNLGLAFSPALLARADEVIE